MPETRLQVIYSVTSTTYATNLFKVTGNFVKAELADGTELPSTIFNQENKAYRFDETGLTSVFYTLCGNTLVNEEFEGMTRIVAINVPSNVSSIPERCFRNCTLLSSVTLASSVSTLGAGAFDGDESLVFIEIPSTALTIGDRVFAGCTSLSAINVYDATAPSPSQYTFFDVKTGGTLTYPAGADYSSWLSNNTYYLGYYNWNGVESGATPEPPEPPTPSGDTSGETVVATALTITGLVPVGGAGNPTPFGFYVYASPIGADIDLSANSSNPGMFSYAGSATGIDDHTVGHSGETYAFFYYDYNSAVTGSTLFTFADSISNLQVQTTVYNNPSGTSPNIYYSPSAITLPASALSWDANRVVASMVGDGCVASGPDDHGHNYSWSEDGPNPDSWGNTAPYFDFAQTDLLLQRNPANSGDSRWYKYYKVLKDTAGNYYMPDHKPFVLYQEASGSTPSDSYIRFSESARTVHGSAQGTSVDLDYSGCTPLGGSKAFSATGTLDITGVTVYLGSNYVFCSISFPDNTGSTSLQADVRVEFDDTSGNTYYDTIHITQGIQTDINFSPKTHSIQGQANRVTSTAIPINCTVSSITFSAITITLGTWDEYPTYTINGNDVTFVVPANDTNAFRYLTYAFEITDTNGNVYNKTISISQVAQSRWVYLNPSGRTHNAYTDGSTSFSIRGSGCSINRSYTPTFTFSGDTSWIGSIERITYTRLQSAWTVYYKVSRNLGASDREIYITANGVHDTDGNVYNDLVYHATQNYGSYVFLNYDSSSASSAASVDTIEVVPVNTTICSVSVTGSASSTPDLWTGVTQPTVTILGNYITVNWPENPYSTNRNYQLNVEVVWGESCENTTTLTFNKNQNAGSTPVQKDIKAADADYSVGSGTGNASTTIQTSGSTYDHFTYITGGSFSVTATSGPNNTIVFTYPENPTTSPRTGYVYITFYDSDGNTYGPQTITFTQQAGSSPGPGPGPDPETGYVLTTLTISDQEQHRYFVEARPGVVYSAAGQYYKTVLACEARYSLYYVNSYGGVDVLPFKEKSWKKSDTVTRFNYSRSFRNNTLEFENVNYMNEIKASWELHTGWMSDESSQRMHELVESTIVYLYDAEEKEYTPVVMTDKKLEYKTYYNQGKKFYNYTVNVEESQSRERR